MVRTVMKLLGMENVLPLFAAKVLVLYIALLLPAFALL